MDRRSSPDPLEAGRSTALAVPLPPRRLPLEKKVSAAIRKNNFGQARNFTSS